MAADCSTLNEIAKTLIQTSAIIVGWVVVHRLSAARDKDKARREMLSKAADTLCEDVGKLFHSAKDYHLTERDKSLEINLKMTLQDISMRTSQLVDITTEPKEIKICRKALIDLKKTITYSKYSCGHIASETIISSIKA